MCLYTVITITVWVLSIFTLTSGISLSYLVILIRLLLIQGSLTGSRLALVMSLSLVYYI